jgi:hypothetical protein
MCIIPKVLNALWQFLATLGQGALLRARRRVEAERVGWQLRGARGLPAPSVSSMVSANWIMPGEKKFKTRKIRKIESK